MPKTKKALHHRKSHPKKSTAWPFVFIGLCVAFGTLAFMPQQIAFAGYISLLVIGVIIATVSGIRMAISPFEESASCGLMYTYVPRYWLYYLVTRKKRMLRPFLWHLGGDALAVASFVALTARALVDPVAMIQHARSHSTPAVVQHTTDTVVVAGNDSDR